MLVCFLWIIVYLFGLAVASVRVFMKAALTSDCFMQLLSLLAKRTCDIETLTQTHFNRASLLPCFDSDLELFDKAFVKYDFYSVTSVHCR